MSKGSTRSSSSVPARIAGFSIAEMLVAAGLLSVLMLAMASLFTQQTRQNRSIAMSSDYSGMINEIRTVLTDKEVCRMAFADTKMENGPIVLKQPAPPISNGTRYGTLLIKIVEFTDMSAACEAPCKNRMYASIHIRSEMTDVIGSPTRESWIPLIAEVDSSDPPKITGCLVRPPPWNKPAHLSTAPSAMASAPCSCRCHRRTSHPLRK